MLKEDIINIQHRFTPNATEISGIKLYVIKNIEKANKQVLNSLLKFIEEPPKNTYALFFSLNPENIISTISSRCNVISIDDRLKDFDNSNHEINELLHDVFSDYDYYLSFTKEFDINKLYEISKIGINIKSTSDEINFVKQIKEISKNELFIVLKFLIQLSNSKKRVELIEILNNVKLNMNKNTSAMKIASIMKGE